MMMTSQPLVHMTNFCGFIFTFIRPITTKPDRMLSQNALVAGSAVCSGYHYYTTSFGKVLTRVCDGENL